MAIWNFIAVNKDQADKNNYKKQLFDTVSNGNEVANMSVIKKYFDRVYQNGGSDWDSFTTDQTLDKEVYVSEVTTKARKLADYRQMALFPEIASAIDTMCYSAVITDQNGNVVNLNIKDKRLEASEVQAIKDAAQEYLDLFDFNNNFTEYFRKMVIEGQLCWQNIIAKDDKECGIIDVNFIPADAYEFCWDIKQRKKYGIMITNIAASEYNLTAAANGLTNINIDGAAALGSHLANLNCYQQLQQNEVLVIPFNQLTYVDSGIYSFDNKMVFSPLERARRAYNQLMLIEDAILIYRMVRAPEKYVFNVDIGKMGAAKGQQKVAQLKKQFGTKKTYDPATGTVGKAYDPMQMTENFWFVKGADSEGIKVQTLTSQHNFGNLDDLEYFYKKLLKSLNIPLDRHFGERNAVIQNNPENGLSNEELNFAKFIISLQQRFAAGITEGVITHLKLKGIWDLYKLQKSDIQVVFTEPTQYQRYRRQKILEGKIAMMKSVLGEQIAHLFSEEYALTYFMGWDKDTIQLNSQQKFKEQVRAAQREAILGKVKQGGTIDIVSEELGWKQTFKQILQKDLLPSSQGSSNESSEGEEGSEGGDEGFDFGGGEEDFGGGQDFGGGPEEQFGGGGEEEFGGGSEPEPEPETGGGGQEGI